MFMKDFYKFLHAFFNQKNALMIAEKLLKLKINKVLILYYSSVKNILKREC